MAQRFGRLNPDRSTFFGSDLSDVVGHYPFTLLDARSPGDQKRRDSKPGKISNPKIKPTTAPPTTPRIAPRTPAHLYPSMPPNIAPKIVNIKIQAEITSSIVLSVEPSFSSFSSFTTSTPVKIHKHQTHAGYPSPASEPNLSDYIIQQKAGQLARWPCLMDGQTVVTYNRKLPRSISTHKSAHSFGCFCDSLSELVGRLFG